MYIKKTITSLARYFLSKHNKGIKYNASSDTSNTNTLQKVAYSIIPSLVQ